MAEGFPLGRTEVIAGIDEIIIHIIQDIEDWQIFSSFSPFLGHPHGDEHGQDKNHTDG